MNRICTFLIILFFCFTSNKSYSQTNNTNAKVIQKKADKWQLVNGVKLESGTPKTNLIKIEATKVSPSINSKNATDIPKKKDKAVKPPKILKYGNQKSSKVKMISPTTVVPNTTKRKDIKLSKSKYQRKKIMTKAVKDE